MEFTTHNNTLIIPALGIFDEDASLEIIGEYHAHDDYNYDVYYKGKDVTKHIDSHLACSIDEDMHMEAISRAECAAEARAESQFEDQRGN